MPNGFLLVLFAFLSTSLPAHERVIEDATIKPPPTFVTSPARPDCVSKHTFPQRVKLPRFKDTWQTHHICKFYDRDYTAWSMIIFYEEWVKTFGDKEKHVEFALNNLEIEWGIKPRRISKAYDINGILIEKPQVWGLMEDPLKIWVYVTDDMNLSDTAFIHELVHVALNVVNGNPDADHEGECFKGWTPAHTKFLQQVNQRLYKQYGL